MRGSLWFIAEWWHMRRVCPVLAPLHAGCFGSPPGNNVIWGNYLLCVLHGMASEHQYLLLSGTQFSNPLSHTLGKGGSSNPLLPKQAGVSDLYDNTYVMNVHIGRGLGFLH